MELPSESNQTNRSFALNDLFWTIQGEGRWSGYRALFVRLPFCNYQCPWCDTEFNHYQSWSETDFRSFCEREPGRFAVLTGGEPMAHKDLPQIIATLKELGFFLACETNGSLPIPPEIDFVTISPKPYGGSKYPGYFILPENLNRAHEFKYVVDDRFDFAILDRHQPRQQDITYSLSPEHSQMPKMVKKILAFTAKNPQWRFESADPQVA